MKKRILSLLLTGILTVGMLSGCGGKDKGNSVTMAGSTSMEKLCQGLIESYNEKAPDTVVTAEYTGSGAGLESLLQGSVDIGNSSRKLKDEEKEKGLYENIVATDGIGMIVNKENQVGNLNTDQLLKIYQGKITNWKELGSIDESIVVIGREAGSGTRDAFEELIEAKDTCKYAGELDSTGAVLAKVANTRGAIGYVSLDVIDDTVNTISLNDVEPSEGNILSGKYLLSRPFVMATKGPLGEQTKAVQDWFNYIYSAEGKEVIKAMGLVVA